MTMITSEKATRKSTTRARLSVHHTSSFWALCQELVRSMIHRIPALSRPILASFEDLRVPLELLFEFRDRRRLLRFGERWVRADHLDLVLDEGALSLGIAA